MVLDPKQSRNNYHVIYIQAFYTHQILYYLHKCNLYKQIQEGFEK